MGCADGYCSNAHHTLALQVSNDLLFDAQRDLDDVDARVSVYPRVRTRDALQVCDACIPRKYELTRYDIEWECVLGAGVTWPVGATDFLALSIANENF